MDGDVGRLTHNIYKFTNLRTLNTAILRDAPYRMASLFQAVRSPYVQRLVLVIPFQTSTVPDAPHYYSVIDACLDEPMFACLEQVDFIYRGMLMPRAVLERMKHAFPKLCKRVTIKVFNESDNIQEVTLLMAEVLDNPGAISYP